MIELLQQEYAASTSQGVVGVGVTRTLSQQDGIVSLRQDGDKKKCHKGNETLILGKRSHDTPLHDNLSKFFKPSSNKRVCAKRTYY